MSARRARTYRLVVTDEQGRELERQRVELTPGIPVDLASCAEDAPLAWRFESLRLEYDADGLPRLQLTLDGARFVHHSAPRLVSTRHATLLEVMAFDIDYRRHDLQVRIRELSGDTDPVGCESSRHGASVQIPEIMGSTAAMTGSRLWPRS
ncbi:hypothetical protein [Halomonas sp. LBP4]|uniref:hypothetical protein n=1 Tax=Halomonas sp. LBP4 TaxID=2044917 RepID=UPI0011B7506A|nr:hypothetical protein [Halomonas sp. LBP4]